MVEAVECTAFDQSATNDRNPLMTPPCSCPRCAAAAQPETVEVASTIWLPVNGRPVRHQVEQVALGATGQAALGRVDPEHLISAGH